jgi:hypothetical protein
VAKLADARDSKSRDSQGSCGFDSHLRHQVVASVALLTLAGGSLLGAQSLGELARRERERRKASAAAARSYTEQDLAEARSGLAPATAPSPAPLAAETPAPEYDRLKDKALETTWRGRFASARTRVAEAEARSWTTRIETVFVNGIPIQQAVPAFEETNELREARQALLALEEDLRRAALPPGWGRE